jgi:hypothetical protein
MTTEEEKKPITLKEFLEHTPPGKFKYVEDAAIKDINHVIFPLNKPILYMYCEHNDCKGWRYYNAYNEDIKVKLNSINNIFLSYYCRNCGQSLKTYAIRALMTKYGDIDMLFKYGETPPFGPPTPPRAVKLIGPDKELFYTGRRAENQGMGIGAFTYYRRVVENQKNKIIDEIIRVTNKISPDDPVIQELEGAKGQFQFTKAVETIKHALPQSLLINGHNPLTLLYSTLSEGVHDHSDAECLELASDIRTVLFEFAEKLGQALKEDAEIGAAVKRITGRKKKKCENN